MSQPEAEGLVARVERLERANRRLRRILLASAVLAAGGMLLAPSAPRKEAPKALKAREVQVVDDQGATRISMTIGAGGEPELTLAGAKGGAIRLAMAEDRPLLSLGDGKRVRVLLGIDKEGASLALDDADGKRTATVQAGGTTGLAVTDSTAEGLEAFLVLSGNGPSLALSAPDEGGGEASVRLWVSPATGPLVAASKGLAASRLDVSTDGDPSVTLQDAKGRDRAVLGVAKLEVERKKRGKSVENGKEKTDPSSLVLFDTDETVVWKAP